jgi:hypothetical protein
MAINIFLSVGTHLTTPQESFVSGIEQHLKDHGLRPRTVGRNQFIYKQPLTLVHKLLKNSAGVLVIAVERLAIKDGLEHAGPPEGTRITNASIATPWNQIEAAFAYAMGIPLLVIREDTVRAEGLLDGRYDWYVHETPLNTSFLETQDFTGVFESWREDVLSRAGWFRYRRQ